MAVVRARSAPPYGAFVGFFLFGVATVAAVACYFMYAKSTEELDSVRRQGGTTVSSLAQARGDVERLQKELASLTNERDSAKQERDRNAASIAEFQKISKTSLTDAEAHSKALDAARAEFAKAQATLSEDKRKLDTQVAQLNRDRDAAIAKSQTDLDTAQKEWEDKNRDRVLEVDDLRSQIAQKENENRELRIRLGLLGRQGVPTVGEPDGTVVRVNQGTGEAYILLGKKDRIVPGLTFTAYDPRLGVRFGNEEAAAGNGSLEVIEVGETTSLCRITRTTPNKVIQAGDYIANIVYHTDKTRLFRFVVRGDFDLDGDGIATAAERDRIVRLVVTWGGKVDDNVSSQTDYVVVGAKPQSIASVELAPDDAAAAPAAPEPGSVADQRRKEQDDYDTVIGQASRLSIPVLNANRFLAMVGYYNTTIVRYGAAK